MSSPAITLSASPPLLPVPGRRAATMLLKSPTPSFCKVQRRNSSPFRQNRLKKVDSESTLDSSAPPSPLLLPTTSSSSLFSSSSTTLVNEDDPNLLFNVNTNPSQVPVDDTQKRSSQIIGFAYANNKRNKEFHRLFHSVPPNDHLLGDYSCALSKDILIQGRLYVSEHNICFNSKILGWVTNLVIPFDQIIGLEKKMTAGLFPNAISIQTMDNRYNFASFISRDSVFEFLSSIWNKSSEQSESDNVGSDMSISDLEEDDDDDDFENNFHNEHDSIDDDDEGSGYDTDESDLQSLVSIVSETTSRTDLAMAPRQLANPSNDSGAKDSSKPDDSSDKDSGNSNSPAKKSGGSGHPNGTSSNSNGTNSNANGDDGDDGKRWPVNNLGPESHDPTDPSFNLEKSDEKLLLKETVNAPLGVVANLLFGNDVTFFTQFNQDNQKNFDLKNFGAFNALEENGSRQYEYIKPINGAVGPKQTRCICTDNIQTWDLDKSVGVVTTTKSPDVPSGNSFVVLTRYTLFWGPNNTTVLQLSYKMEWSARSFLKGPIEKGTLDGQMKFAVALVKELNSMVAAKQKAKSGSLSRSKSKSGKLNSKSSSKRKKPSKEKLANGLPSDKQSQQGSSLSQNGGFVTSILDTLMSMPFDYVPIPLGGLLAIFFVTLWLVLRLVFGWGASSSSSFNIDDAELAQLLMNSRLGLGNGLGLGGAAAGLGFGLGAGSLGLSNLAALAAVYANNDINDRNLIFGSRDANSHLFGNNNNNGVKMSKQLKAAAASSVLATLCQEQLARARLQEEYILLSWIEDRIRYLTKDGGAYESDDSENVNVDGTVDEENKEENNNENGNEGTGSEENGDDLLNDDRLDTGLKQNSKKNKRHTTDDTKNLKKMVKLSEMRLNALKKELSMNS